MGCFAAGVVFYTITTRTLEEHTKSIDTIKNNQAETKKENLLEREKIREAFLIESKATSSGIAELNKQTAVMATTLIGIEKALDRFGQKLDAVGPGPSTR